MSDIRLSVEQAIKYVDAHLTKDRQPALNEISNAVERVNRLIALEREHGLGTPATQLELFESLIFNSRKSRYVGEERFTKWMLAKLVLTKWAEMSKNSFAVAYQVGHEDGNINGSFHASKRGGAKVEKTKQHAKNIASNRAKTAANALHSQPGGSHEKKAAILAIWATGNYWSRDLCAEEECAGIGLSYSKTRKHLIGTPDNPRPKPQKT